MTAVWTCGDLSAALVLPERPDWGVVVRVQRRGEVLRPEQMRGLRDWLTGRLGDGGQTPAAADPDVVRLAVDAQRAALADRSAGACSEDFRAGLAWADAALRAVAVAAGATS